MLRGGEQNGIDIFGGNSLGVADAWNEVRIGGVDVREMDSAALMARIAIVFQDVYTSPKVRATDTAGNTGAAMAVAMFVVGVLRGVDRPAIATVAVQSDGKIIVTGGGGTGVGREDGRGRGQHDRDQDLVFAELRGHRNRSSFVHRRMRADDAVELRTGDVLAAAADDVFLARDEKEIAVLVAPAEVCQARLTCVEVGAEAVGKLRGIRDTV